MKSKHSTETLVQILAACDGRKLSSVTAAHSVYARRARLAAVHSDDNGTQWVNLTPKGRMYLRTLK